MTTIDEFVDRIFVINILTRIDKYEKMVKQFEELGIKNYERFDAYVPTEESVHNDQCQSELDKRLCFRGAIGCKFSHFNAIKEAKKRGYNRILILEDDALFVQDFVDKFSRVSNEINFIDWSILYIGANHKEKGKSVTKSVKRCSKAFTTSSYILSSKVYDQILREAPGKMMEIDTYYVECVQNLGNCYAVSPNLVTQFPSTSDISGNYTDYDFGEC